MALIISVSKFIINGIFFFNYYHICYQLLKPTKKPSNLADEK